MFARKGCQTGRIPVYRIYADLRRLDASLFGILHTANLAQQRDLDLAGVGHFVFDLLGDIASHLHGGFVVDFIGVDNHADFAAGLNRIGALHPLEPGGDLFEFFKPLDVTLQGLPSGTRSRGADGIGGRH